MKKPTFLLSLLLLSTTLLAEVPLGITKITDNIFALVGETNQRSEHNYANNSTHGVIITNDGVILVDPGGSYLGAKQIHNAIKTLTDKPVKLVINTGGQDHRWFGNDYFNQLGATIVASSAAQADQKAREDEHIMRLTGLIGDALEGTTPLYATSPFAQEKKTINWSGVELELHYAGPAHTAGDIFVWLPNEKIMFSGDIVFVNRALGVGPARNINSWIAVFEKMASFNPDVIVPGHGKVTDLEEATNDTYNYLVHLRDSVAKVIDDGGDMIEATNIDQEKFRYLKNFDDIAKRNAQWTFEILEFE